MIKSPSFVELSSVKPNQFLVHARIDISPEDGELPEHFPGSPVVPAYMQLQWLEQILDSKIPALQIKRFADVKFLQAINPPQSVVVEVVTSKGENFEFRMFSVNPATVQERVLVSKGKIYCEARN